MNLAWPALADLLRNELAEYGELLRLFEAQQQSLFRRQADEVLRLAGVIETQAGRLADCRRARETAVAEFAIGHGRPATASLRSLLPLMEPDARPMLQALINEVNTLLHRVRRTSRHNHVFLARTVELHQQALQQLRPERFTRTYSPAGRVSVASTLPAGTLHVTG